MANAIRALAMDAVETAKSGHPGMPMGMADVATVLFTEHMKYDAAAPDWPDRDRFVLSAGHGSMLLYALLHLTGTPGMTLDELRNFRQLGAKTAGHPEYGHAAGIETTTGPLGQGLANAVGMALAERILNARYGDSIVDHHTWVIAGDGCLMEGISQEAISLAGHLRLGKLVVLFDDNGISIDGPTSLATSEDQVARFKASGWATLEVDGHDPEADSAAIAKARADSSRPWLIACKTRIGFGAPTKEGKASSHGSPLGADEIKGTRERIGWPHAPFDIPAPIASAWKTAGARGKANRSDWETRFGELDAAQQETLLHPDAAAKGAIDAAIKAAKEAAIAETGQKATRVWSELTINRLADACPSLIGGSAPLPGANLPRAISPAAIAPGNFAGSYVHYGVREHAMAAAMNGMALHGGLLPYGGTFMAFTDYCRPSIRLSALMGLRVIYVMTHDSIGLGEDGPTHQPVEHLAALRAIPNLHVFRPADGVETAECWALSLETAKTPSILALTRQGVPNLRTADGAGNQSAKGGYVIRAPQGGERDVTLMATGSEVGLAAAAADALAKGGINAAVVSIPSFELFRQQPEAYRAEVLGQAPRIAVEAGIEQGWREWLRPEDKFIGMSGFGASAPASKLFEHFGITPDNVMKTAKALLK
ncbi:MAG: transketolase [Hyphomicrobiaceae bacterium]